MNDRLGGATGPAFSLILHFDYGQHGFAHTRTVLNYAIDHFLSSYRVESNIQFNGFLFFT